MFIGVDFQDGFHYACRTPLADEIDERKPVLRPQCPGLTHPRHLRYHHSLGSQQKLWPLQQPQRAGSRGIPQTLLKRNQFQSKYINTISDFNTVIYLLEFDYERRTVKNWLSLTPTGIHQMVLVAYPYMDLEVEAKKYAAVNWWPFSAVGLLMLRPPRQPFLVHASA